MRQVLVDYIKRFDLKNSGLKIDKFFTQLSIDEYPQKLPYLYGIENFCLRLYQALWSNEKICIYSDYDTDAVTATATMYWGLIELGFKKENLDFYVPDRFTEGYGMNTEAVAELAAKYDLLISVDCGINSTSEAEIVETMKLLPDTNSFRQNSFCDLIITDHHHLQSNLPNCTAVLNPRLAEYYFDNPQEADTIDNKFTILIDSLEHLNLVPKEKIIEIINWKNKLIHDPLSFAIDSHSFLSSSVTGVGVAWFCVLWLGYFLADIAD